MTEQMPEPQAEPEYLQVFMDHPDLIREFKRWLANYPHLMLGPPMVFEEGGTATRFIMPTPEAFRWAAEQVDRENDGKG